MAKRSRSASLGWQLTVCASLLGCHVLGSEAAAYTHDVKESQVTLEVVQNLAEGKMQHGIVGFHQSQVFDLSDDTGLSAWHLTYRLLTDTVAFDTDKGIEPSSLELEKILLYYERSLGGLHLSAGMMEVTWGENLLMPILDVVNHRNVFHHRGYYDPAAKVPSLMMQAQWRGEIFSWQAIAVPLPLAVPHPDEIQGFTVGESEPTPAGEYSEFGGRFGAFFLGIDTNLYYFRHGPRLPSYKFQAYSGDADLLPNTAMGETYGASASYATYTWIWRADYAFHTRYPAINIGSDFEQVDLAQAIVGATYAGEGGGAVGFEIHGDFWGNHTAANTTGAFVSRRAAQQDLYWYGFTATTSLLQERLQAFALGLKGVEKDDHLLRGSLLYNLDDSSSFGIELQSTKAQSNSPKLLLDERRTFGARYTVSF